ncbi:ATP-binding protein [Savagea sp. SN6]|uniref:ATP-binding protein n=1 Tax=Savagea serpentis TaxID=2785297 RepID=A0A8J7G4Q5_9BACL|nr:ATP-binding protein [Savagea serpentis]MBF4501192.1 ATP-binding protein [Savagea serpentis]
MKSVKELHPMLKIVTKEKIVETKKCKCNQVVQVVEIILPGGPRKGETAIINKGCKCEDLKLAKQAEITHAQVFLNNVSLVNDDLKQAAFENFEVIDSEFKRVRDVVYEFALHFDPKSESKQTFIFTGTYGIGKSHLAYATAKHVANIGYTAMFINLPQMLTKIKASYNQTSHFSETSLMNRITKVDLLILDDIGADNASTSEWGKTKLFEVLDSRLNKYNIYTTNLGSEELKRAIGERNLSRLMDQAEIFKMHGEDFRRRHLKK